MATQDGYGRAVNGTVIPPRRTRDIPVTEPPKQSERMKQGKHPLTITGVTMCVCLLILLVWQTQVVPRWTHYEDQLACGSGHVCKAVINVAPSKSRTFIVLIENARITVIELPDSSGNDSHVYLGTTLSDWQDITLHIKSVPHGGYDDILLDAPEFQGADPVLYNHNGSYSWK